MSTAKPKCYVNCRYGSTGAYLGSSSRSNRVRPLNLWHPPVESRTLMEPPKDRREWNQRLYLRHLQERGEG